MTEEELIYTLALQKAPKIGDITAKKLIHNCGTAKAVFYENVQTLQKINGIGSYATSDLNKTELLKKAEDEIKYLNRNAIQYWYFLDEQYPQNLKNCIDAPILLFYSGKIDFNNPKIISVVGTRKLTNSGKYFCEQLIAELSLLNPIIVSGLAYGTDITAHNAAINNNLQTVGCLAHGLNQIYPKAHKKYVKDIEQNGGLVTDFWSTSNPERENFLKRNRIIAGLSQATVVIESAEKGGSLVTADIANSYHRDVFAVPGRVQDIQSVGCNNLIKQQKAQLITSAADLIYMLNWDLEKQQPKIIQPQLFLNLSDTETLIVDFLQKHNKAHLDVLSNSCNLAVHKLSSTLLNLELKGITRPLPGKFFELV